MLPPARRTTQRQLKTIQKKGAEMRRVNFNARTVIGACAISGATILAIATGCRDSSATEARQNDPASAVAGGAHVDGKNFTLDAAAAGDCKAGAECHVTITLKAAGDYHINKEYPYKFKAEGSGVEFLGSDAAGKNTFSKSAGDFVIDSGDPAKSATMTVKFKPAAKGTSTIKGTFKMSVCSAQNCQLETQDISVDIPVK
jgi:hypothetical protein